MKQLRINFLALSILISSSTISANFSNEKSLTWHDTATTFYTQHRDGIIISSLVIACVGTLFLSIKCEQNRLLYEKKRLLEERERERTLTDNTVIQIERENLASYKFDYEHDCNNAQLLDIDSFMLSIKQKNSFPYFIPYRRKVAYAHSKCIESLDRINARLNPQFNPHTIDRNPDGLIALKNEYEEFIQKLEILKEVAYQCIKLSTPEYPLFHWILSTACIRENETPSFFFSYLVDDLI